MNAKEFLKAQEMYGSGAFDCPEFEQDVIKFAEDYANQSIKEVLERIINKGGGFLVINEAHYNETVRNRMFEELNKLKQ